MAAPANHGMSLASALDRSAPLSSLLERVRGSQDRFAAVAALLPPGLQDTVRPGPLDEAAWALLADNAAAAAKLRQMLPALTRTLLAQGWATPPIRIKVLPRARLPEPLPRAGPGQPGKG